jgi:hypothetical protein
MGRVDEVITFLQAGCLLTVEARCNIDGGPARLDTAYIHVILTGTHGIFMALSESWIGREL